MAGKNVLAGLSVAAGRKAAGMVSAQANGANQVHAIAVHGEYAARAQTRAHEHFIATSKHLHEITNGKGPIQLNVGSSGETSASWGGKTKKSKENGGKPTSPAATDEARSSVPANRQIEDKSNESELTKNPNTGVYEQNGENADRNDTSRIREITSGRKALKAGKPERTYTPARGGRVVPGNDAKRNANGAIEVGPARADMTSAQKAAQTRRNNAKKAKG